MALVFGTARRGVDIPHVSPGFESNVPGLFIAGELGGMGLIANAFEQGRQAIDSDRRLDGLGRAGGQRWISSSSAPARPASRRASPRASTGFGP